MELRVCEFCGTEFSAELTECPLCGKAVDPDELLLHSEAEEDLSAGQDSETRTQERKKPGQRLAARQKKGRGGKFASGRKEKPEKKRPQEAAPSPDGNPYRIPKWMMVLICIFLGLAVMIGAAFALYNLGVFGKRTSSLSSQADSQEQQTEQAAQASQSQPATEAQYTNEEDYQSQKSEEQAQPAAVTCTGLTLGTTTVTFDEADQFANLTVQVTPSDCTEEVIYTSSDDTIATVNAQGKVVAVKGGSATITATCGTQTATCLVTCDFTVKEETTAEQTTAPTLNSTDMTLFYPGEKATLTVKDAPAGAAITFASSDTSIATVTDSGVVSAVSGGTATVTVKVGETALSCIVRCSLDSSAETGGQDTNCKISNSDVTMAVSGEYFKLTLTDSGGNTVSGLTWTSSDTAVCTVDASGVVYAAGSGTAYVSTSYGGKTYQCIVRCHLG